MNKFEINQCPLCYNVLKLRKVSSVNTFYCITSALTNHSHYEVELDTQASVQHIYIDNCCIDNFPNISKSRIFIQNNLNRWILIAEIPHLKPEIEASMSAKLNKFMRAL